MATITTRSGKGSPLTNNEVDANFTNLNTDKAELSGATFTGEIVAPSLDISGNIDVDGTTNLDATNIVGALDVTGTATISTDLNVGGAVKGNAGTRVVSVGTAGSVAGGLQLWADTDEQSFVQFGDEAGTSANHYRGFLSYNHATDAMQLGTASAARVTISSLGKGTFSSSVFATNFNFTASPNYAGTSLGIYNNGTWLNTSANTTGFLGVAGTGMLSWHTGGVNLVGSVIINEAGADADFRVESNNNANMLFVDGGGNRVGIGRVPSISNSKLEVSGADNVSLINVEASGVTGGMGIGSSGLQFFHGSSSKMAIDSGGHTSFTLGTNAMGTFGDSISEVGSGNFSLQVTNSAGSALKPLGFRAEDIRFATGSTERLRITDASTRIHNSLMVGATTAPSGKLHIKNGASGATYTADGADQVILENNDSMMMDIRTPSGNTGGILFSDNNARGRGVIQYAHSNDTMYINTAGASALTLDSSQNASFSAAVNATEVRVGNLVNNGTISANAVSGRQALTAKVQNNGNSIFQGFNASDDLITQITGAGALTHNGTANFSGDVSVPNISVADDIRHSGDSDTYISFEANNQTFYAGGTRALDIAAGSVVLNEGGGDVDFRVESSGNASMFAVDGGGNFVDIGGAGAIGGQLNILGDEGIRGRKASNYKTATMMQPTAFGYSVGTYAVTQIGDSNTQGTVSIGYDPAGNSSGAFSGTGIEMLFAEDMAFLQPNASNNGYVPQFRMEKSTGVTINENGLDLNFRVESDGNDHMLFVDGGKNQVGIGTGSTNAKLEIANASAGEQAFLITSPRNDSLSNGLARINLTDSVCPFTALQIDHAGTGLALDVSGKVKVSGTTNDGSTLTQITQSGTGRGLGVNRNVASATRAMVNLVQGHASGGTQAVLDVQQSLSSSRAIRVTADGTTDRFSVYGTGALVTTPPAGGHAVFNAGGVDADFQVKSDANSNMIFVDGGNNRVGIGDNLTNGALTIGTSGVGSYNQITVTNTTAANVNKLAGLTTLNYAGDNVSVFQSFNQNNGANTLYFGSADSSHRGYTTINTYLSSSNTATTNHRRIHTASYSSFVVNEDGADVDFRVESDGNANMLFVDGGNNRVVVGSDTGNAVFAVKRNSPDGGRLASFGSEGVAGTDVCVGTGGAVSIARSVIIVQPNTVTNLVSGYGGSHVMMVVNSPSGVADVQRTVVATHAWSALSVLFSNNYGTNNPTFTFSVGSGVLKVSHNHSGALRFGVACLIVPAPTTGQ